MNEYPYLMKLRYAFQTKQKLYIVIDFYKGGELLFLIINRQNLALIAL